MPPQLAFLIGAGASKGAGRIQPKPPPLSGELYGALRSAYPRSWGRVTGDLDRRFRDDFEVGMWDCWSHGDETTARLLIDMAIYFSWFEAPADRSDCYSRLLSILARSGLVPNTAFASLNYECVLETAAGLAGFRLSYAADRPPPRNVLVFKPHGSCNFIPQASVWNIGIDLSATGGAASYLEGPILPRLRKQVRELYGSGFAIPPAMSLFARGKFNPVSNNFIAQLRHQWANWVAGSHVITIVGVRPLLVDNHVWDPILTGEGDIWYVGGRSGDYDELTRQVGRRLVHLADRFAEGLPSLERRLTLLS